MASSSSSSSSLYLNPIPNPHHPLLFLSLSLLLLVSSMPSSPLLHSCEPSTPLVSFLERLQSAALATLGPKSFDPKLYVDLPLRHNLSATEDAFDWLPRPAATGAIPGPALEAFIGSYFDAAGSDLVHAEPDDFVAEPQGFLPKVENPVVRAWALEVHSLWKNLTRRVSDRVKERPELHTLLPIPGPVVVPGERFREVYYWDSYWIIRGLLASKMYDTAKAIVHNLISLIDTYGYVLNGARAYYSNRSQPPLLSAMVLQIYLRTRDLAFVKNSLPALLKEHNFWTSGIHQVTVQDALGHRHALSRYYAMWNKPRPESSTIDEQSASKILSMTDKEIFYRQLASTAESGWDFSSRWMSNPSDLTTLKTISILPVDLNAYIYKRCIGFYGSIADEYAFKPKTLRFFQGMLHIYSVLGSQMELDIAYFAKLTGDRTTLEKFFLASKARHAAMKSIFWNPDMNQWLDYWLTSTDNCEEVHQWEAKNQNQKVYASNFIPLWVEILQSDGKTVGRVVKSLQSSGLIHAAGIATSLANTGEQWDFPNGWAPLQHMIVEGLARSGSEEARCLAEDIATRWIRTNYAAYKTTGTMHEKYDVETCGSIGGGGEYKPQTGFGWSNGVVLAFLEEFGWPRNKEIGC